MLLNYHIGCLVLSSLCIGALVRLVLGGVRFVGFSLVLISVRLAWTVHRTLRTPDNKPHLSCISDRCLCSLPGHTSWNYEDEGLAVIEVVRLCGDITEGNYCSCG